MLPPVTVDRITPAGIPTLHVYPTGLQGPAPLVIYHHGWSSNKENQIVVAESLACRGYRVLVPDAPRHGERDALATYDAGDFDVFWGVVTGAVQEDAILHTAALEAGWVEDGRIGLAGHSMGGMIVSGSLARHPWVRVAVMLDGCPCYEWLLDDHFRNLGTPTPQAARLKVRDFDPERLVAEVAPRPLLMVHGDADQAVPIGGVRRFRDLATPLYAAVPDRLALTELPHLDHYVTTPAILEMRDWFRRYL